MAVYKLFANKDNYIESSNPENNYGRDEVLELSSKDSKSRILINFDNEELTEVLNNISGSYQGNIKLFTANASSLPLDYSIEFIPLSQSWDMGSGRNHDIPNPRNGSCWNSPQPSILWETSSLDSYKISQSFSYLDSKDINCDITNIISEWNTQYDNNGLLIKLSDEDSDMFINYFSIDTHTIYPPHIELYWDDTIYSSSLNQLNNTSFTTIITNLKNEFNNGDIYTFKIKNRDKYPIRNFQTSSLYLNNKLLPPSSYWALKDVKTEEIVIDFNNIGTKLGANNEGNYFNIDFRGLQPERYYQILLKTIINGNEIIINNNFNYFKLVR